MGILTISGLLAAIGGAIAVIYNRLVALRQNHENAYADIDVQLQQRFDLIPNLVETVKGYAAHEKEVFAEVTKMRAGVSEASTKEERLQAEKALGKAMINVMAVAENYPELKADQNFQKLMAELADIENKLAAARRFFNNATSELNTAIEQFPANLLASRFGFEKGEFYEVDEAERKAMEQVPNIDFGTGKAA